MEDIKQIKVSGKAHRKLKIQCAKRGVTMKQLVDEWQGIEQ